MKDIVLSNGMVATVDDQDFHVLSQHKWGVINNGSHIYASRGTRKKGQKYKKVLMHRFLMGEPKGKMIDHINGNTLDNRKENLRLANRSNNLQNSKLRSDSKCSFKGVSRKTSEIGTVRYTARIQINPNERLFLGYFETEIEAAKAYNVAAVKHFGEFAKLNKV